MLNDMMRPTGETAREWYVVCHACDLVHRRGAIVHGARVRCVRCRAELYRTNSASIDTAMALAVSALILLALSNAYPLVALQVNGAVRATTLFGATLGLYDQGYVPVAALVLVTTILVPLFQIAALLYVLIPLRRNGRARGQNAAFRALARLRPWAMTEVFLLGAIVALVKLSVMAEVIPGIALFSYGGMMLMLSALSHLTPTEQFWRWVGAAPT
jgi:paraquat-inducible protein A